MSQTHPPAAQQPPDRETVPQGMPKSGLRRLILRLFQALGFDLVRRRPGFDVASALIELDHQRAFRKGAEQEIKALKKRTELLNDEVRVEKEYLSALQTIVAAPQPKVSASDGEFLSCPWIEGGLSLIPGRLRVCPYFHVGGGTPGLLPFTDGLLPVDQILERREIIRQGLAVDGFAPCANCTLSAKRRWEPKQYAFDLFCIAHATACNLACNYCHTIAEDLHLQNPKHVPRLLPAFEALVADGHLSPEARIQWGGGEPTILLEFDPLFDLFKRHGAFSEVYTNAIKVPKSLLEGMAEDRAGVMISLDAGTAETYSKIKGRSVFDRVVANIGRFAAVNPGRTMLKMIITEENMHEVPLFLDIAERAGVRIVCHDTIMYQDKAASQVLDASALFRTEAARRGMEYRIGEVGSIFNPDDHIEERIEGIRVAAP